MGDRRGFGLGGDNAAITPYDRGGNYASLGALAVPTTSLSISTNNDRVFSFHADAGDTKGLWLPHVFIHSKEAANGTILVRWNALDASASVWDVEVGAGTRALSPEGMRIHQLSIHVETSEMTWGTEFVIGGFR